MRIRCGKSRWRLTCLATLCVAIAGNGCAQDTVGPLVAVQGRVLVGDQPLTSGSVILHPDGGKGNKTPHEPRGEIDAQGGYTVFTAERAGAPAGWYRVTVVSQSSKATDADPYAVPQSNIAAKHADPNTSGLVLEVKDGAAPESYDLKVGK